MERKFNTKKIIIITVSDLVILAITLLSFAYFDHVKSWIPDDQKSAPLPGMPNDENEEDLLFGNDDEENDFFFDDENDTSDSDNQSSDDKSQGNDSFDASNDEQNGNEGSGDTQNTNSIFTKGEVISTETVYKSENVCVTLKEIKFDNKLYFVEDIYVKKIQYLAVGFAKGSRPGSGDSATIKQMSDFYKDQGYNIVATINGDYCGLNKYGAIIRNGVLYGTGVAEYDVCIIYKNGEMVTMDAKDFNAEAELAKGAWHVWDFGPNLLDENSGAIDSFPERKDISKSNPRTAIGYYSPGHYCFVVAGGRGEKAYGVTLAQLSSFMESLGCDVAYNLDGGRSSVMIFGDEIVNEEYQDTTRKNTDIVFVYDPA